MVLNVIYKHLTDCCMTSSDCKMQILITISILILFYFYLLLIIFIFVYISVNCNLLFLLSTVVMPLLYFPSQREDKCHVFFIMKINIFNLVKD